MHHTPSASPDLYVRGTNILRRCHDVGVGLFKGMVTATVERVSPYVTKLEAKYQTNSRVVNSVLVGTAAGGFCCAPWWTLAVAALVVPSVYVGYRFNAPHETTSCTETDNPVNNAMIIPGLPITNLRLLPYEVTEETEILLARLVPVFISVLQVALELRDTARDQAASSVKVIAALEKRAVGEEAVGKESVQRKQQRSVMKKLLTDKHFMTLAANQQASEQMLVAGKVADYNRLAELFLSVAVGANLDRSLPDSAELSVWLLNEMLKTWMTLSPDEIKDRLKALLAEDRLDVVRQLNINILREELLSASTAPPRSIRHSANEGRQ